MKDSIMGLSERRDHLTENKKRKTKEEKKLSRAIDILASIIETKAALILDTIKNGERNDDIKQIKELTGAVKELSSLIYQSCDDGKDDGRDAFRVIFEGEGEEWAK